MESEQLKNEISALPPSENNQLKDNSFVSSRESNNCENNIKVDTNNNQLKDESATTTKIFVDGDSENPKTSPIKLSHNKDNDNDGNDNDGNDTEFGTVEMDVDDNLKAEKLKTQNVESIETCESGTDVMDHNFVDTNGNTKDIKQKTHNESYTIDNQIKFAIKLGQEDVVKSLIDKGVEKTPTLLNIAVSNGHLEIARHLLRRRVPADKSTLQLAVQKEIKNQKEIVQLLLSYNAEISEELAKNAEENETTEINKLIAKKVRKNRAKEKEKLESNSKKDDWGNSFSNKTNPFSANLQKWFNSR